MVREWFFSKFKNFSLPQLFGVLEIHNKNNILITAPTGSGKTLTATLAIINELVMLADYGLLEDKVYCVYINPLRSLSRDLEVNLKKPIQEIQELAKRYGKKIEIRINSRTGDTSALDKAKMLKKPPHIIISTPESLALMLTSPKFKELLKDVKYCIVDEIHALAENKRGVDLSLSLERMQYFCNEEFVRIGLSATISPLEDVAKFLVGSDRPCKIASVEFKKKIDLKVLSPLPDLIDTTHEQKHNALYNLLDNLIQSHRTTLIFTNTRSATERVVHHLKEKFPRKYIGNIGAHHGSLSKRVRESIEKRLRNGELKVIVCSTSLELGIDIGYIDLVICLGSPKSVARLLQRIGRSGHALHETIKGRIIVLDRDDLVECAVLLKCALERKLDRIHIPKNCLDVLAQHIYGIAITEKIHVDSLYRLIKKSFCFSGLSKQDFLDVVNYLAGRYALEARNVYAKIWYDEETGMIGRRGKLARVIYMTNIGTIPEESYVTVKVGNDPVGHIEESFLEKLHKGDVFVLGGNKYKFLYSKGMTAYVSAATEEPPTVPSWYSEMLPLSFDLALEINRFRKLMKEKFLANKPKEEILDFVLSYLYVDKNAAEAIYSYFKEQYLFADIPNGNELVVEFFNEQDGRKYAVVHSLYGRRANEALARALAFVVAKLAHADIDVGINDNGFYLSSYKPMQVLRALALLKSNELRKILEYAIEDTEIFKRRFRHCATRALMILRRYKGREKRIGKQQLSSMLLLSTLKRISKDFCIVKETKREILEDAMDVENAAKMLKWIEQGKIKVKQLATSLPSPFAFNVALQGRLDVMRIEDRTEFLRRMHKYVLAKIGKHNI